MVPGAVFSVKAILSEAREETRLPLAASNYTFCRDRQKTPYAIFVIQGKPTESLLGLITAIAGLIIFSFRESLADYRLAAAKHKSMKKNAMRSPLKVALYIAIVLAYPVFAQETSQQPAAEMQPQQQLQPPTETPAAEHVATPLAPAPQTVVRSSPANDAARYLAGLPVAPGSPLTALSQDPRWATHARAMNVAFSQLEQRQLSNIRICRSENIAPATQSSRNCIYLFSGPDFLYADAMFGDCSTFVLQGLEPVDPIPDLVTLP